MQHGIQKKQDAVDRLEEKRKEIETTANSTPEPANKKQKKVAVVAVTPKEVPQKKAEKKVKEVPVKAVAVSNFESFSFLAMFCGAKIMSYQTKSNDEKKSQID